MNTLLKRLAAHVWALRTVAAGLMSLAALAGPARAVNNANPVAPPVSPSAPGDGGPAVRDASAGPVATLVKIETKRSQEALVQVFCYLNERDVAFTSVEIFNPNLESVFLHLTGKKLRE